MPKQYHLTYSFGAGKAQGRAEMRDLLGGKGFITRAANWALTWLTNILYGSRLTDMETAYKAFTRRAAMDLQLESRGFEIEPEITAKFLRRGVPIHEVPIAYSPRTSREGKKMRWRDGFTAIRTLLRYRWRK